MKNVVINYLSIIGIAMVVLLLISACGEPTKPDMENKNLEVASAVQRDTFNVQINNLIYDDKTQEAMAELTSDIPDEAEILVILKDSKYSSIAKATDVIVKESEPTVVVFELANEAKKNLIDDEYSLEVIIAVNPNADGNAVIKINSDNTFYFENEVEEIVEIEELESVESDSNEFEPVTFTDLSQRYDELNGVKLEVNGIVTQVIEYDEYAFSDTSKSFLVNISEPNNYDADHSIWVEVENPPMLIKGSRVKVGGILLDPYGYGSVSGQKITVPYILASTIITK